MVAAIVILHECLASNQFDFRIKRLNHGVIEITYTGITEIGGIMLFESLGPETFGHFQLTL